jgi:membrane-bound lytic murein transglycosylase D
MQIKSHNTLDFSIKTSYNQTILYLIFTLMGWIMHTDSNRPVKILIFLVALLVSACSDDPKEPLVINDAPDASKSYVNQPTKSSPGFFKKKIKNLFSSHDTVWERMLSLYSFPEVDNERIDAQLSYYLSHPDYIARVQERAAPYMHLILDEIEAKNLPGELALLPVVESAFIPEAYSRSAASGLWQFIPSTGRLFGLEQNSWYDGRRDVYASTVAATKFLKGLSEEFNGDYFLALASYNWGKGNVSKAVMRNSYAGLPTDYWSLDLPKETEDYVPRLLAIAKLFAHAEQYGVRLQPIPNKPYCEVVNVGSQLDIDKAAELAQTPLSQFLKLNPCFKKGSTAPDGPHRLLVPSHRVQAFKESLAQLPYEDRVDQRRHDEEVLAEKIRQNELMAQKMRDEEERFETRRKREVIVSKRYYKGTPTQQYRVHRGETLSNIARTHGTTVEQLRKINHLAKSSVNSGAYLKVPSSSRQASASSRSDKPKSSSGQVYIVKKGDTFFNVSKRFSVSRNDIADKNNISPNASLKLGQKLVFKGGGSAAPHKVAKATASHSRHTQYTVKRGDTLMHLSRKFGVSLNDLRKSNPQANKGLRPGQSIKILVDNSGRKT